MATLEKCWRKHEILPLGVDSEGIGVEEKMSLKAESTYLETFWIGSFEADWNQFRFGLQKTNPKTKGQTNSKQQTNSGWDSISYKQYFWLFGLNRTCRCAQRLHHRHCQAAFSPTISSPSSSSLSSSFFSSSSAWLTLPGIVISQKIKYHRDLAREVRGDVAGKVRHWCSAPSSQIITLIIFVIVIHHHHPQHNHHLPFGP